MEPRDKDLASSYEEDLALEKREARDFKRRGWAKSLKSQTMISQNARAATRRPDLRKLGRAHLNFG